MINLKADVVQGSETMFRLLAFLRKTYRHRTAFATAAAADACWCITPQFERHVWQTKAIKQMALLSRR